mmetsp:Transcript_16322/g.15637  ORF Transcript_16322/g.15637 Transcript_16322/m.15637 type:complete len:964 (+) Transcript_16322:207-3098(+)|eukprot:CAMPEP_0119046606 /NCGR_PEP_ID=MMETSP1177-20130426/47733_1 /TAXON_ID=2985 /ORGANISM="Ochromonas sp, Strain CCMP1899" /LENGTH=963 /DNA_ID=CAMNT_0007019993 /DNA_START=165 /DNA_END=3056 /DNA_ORIENTATION=-
MFTSFEQFQKDLQASLPTLSLDDLQGVKKDETKEAVSNETNGKSKPDSIKSITNEDTELQLVEEISRVSELFRSKDAECLELLQQLSDSKNELQAKDLAFSDIKQELKNSKSSASVVDNYEDKISAIERDNIDLREEIDRQKKIAEERSLKVATLQTQLSQSQVSNEQLKQQVVQGVDGESDGDTAKLRQEISVTKEEALQNFHLLNEANDQISSLEARLEKSKTALRLAEDKATTNERNRITTSKESDEIKMELLDKVKTIEKSKIVVSEEFSTIKTELSNEISVLKEQQKQAVSDISSVKANNDFLEADLLKSKAINNALKEMRDQQASDVAEKAVEMEDLYRSLSQASDAMEQEKSFLVAAQNEITDLHKELTEKKDANVDLQGKLSVLTDKMKDLVKKYQDNKSKMQILEQSGGDKTSEIMKNLQNKESEILSLRMKLDNTERGSADQRRLSAELSERYGETQRELSRTKSTIQEHLITIENLQKDLKVQQDFMILHSKENEESKIQIKSSSIKQEILETRIRELEEGKDMLENQLKSDDDAARVLEEYKKRAQMALKKANSSLAIVTAELTAMKVVTGEAQGRVVEAEELQIEATNRCVVLEKEMKEIRGVMEGVCSERDKAIGAEKVSSETAGEAMNRIRELNVIIQSQKQELVKGKTNEDTSNGTSTPVRISKELDNNVNIKNNNMNSTTEKNLTVKKDKDDLKNDKLNENENLNKNKQDDVDSSKNIDIDNKFREYDSKSSEFIMDRKENTPVTEKTISSAASRRVSTSTLPLESNTENVLEEDKLRAGKAMKSTSPDQLYYVNELYSQIDELRREVANRGTEVESTRQELINESAMKRKLEGRVEELLAYLDRSKKFQGDGPDSATNTEYLKNCVYRFMATTEHSERKRLAPVISTILKLTSQEKKAIEQALTVGEVDSSENAFDTLASFGLYAGSFFGDAAPAPPSTAETRRN